jgi:hypothetical protein
VFTKLPTITDDTLTDANQLVTKRYVDTKRLGDVMSRGNQASTTLDMSQNKIELCSGLYNDAGTLTIDASGGDVIIGSGNNSTTTIKGLLSFQSMSSEGYSIDESGQAKYTSGMPGQVLLSGGTNPPFWITPGIPTARDTLNMNQYSIVSCSGLYNIEDTLTIDASSVVFAKLPTITFETLPDANQLVTKRYVDSTIATNFSNINATAPINYVGSTISATFDDNGPAEGSINLLNSGTIFDALATKQDEITDTTVLTTGTIDISGNLTASGNVTAPVIIQGETNLLAAINTKQDTITHATTLYTGTIDISGNLTASGNVTAPVIIQDGINLLDTINTKQDEITDTTVLTTGTIDLSGNLTASGNVTAPVIIQGETNLLAAINTKQDKLTLQLSLTTSTTEVASSSAIMDYITTNTAPNITVDEPLFYSEGTISGLFDSAPIVGSKNFLSSDTIYEALGLKISNSAIKQDLKSTSTSDVASVPAIAAALAGFIPDISTEYAFQVTSQGVDPPNHLITGGGANGPNPVIPFNMIQICKPNRDAYNKENYIYTIQSPGVYSFGFKLFVESNPETWRVGIYNGSTMIGSGGSQSFVGEAITIVAECAINDAISVKCFSGSGRIYMGVNHSWFWGYKLTPGNNAITTSTDLSVKTLTTSGDVLIGPTPSPAIMGKLHINDNKITTLSSRYYNSSGVNGNTDMPRPLSIYAINHIACAELQVFSDRRIKTNIVDVPDDLALQQVRDIPCRYYDYIDNVNDGTEKTIGFIAQEVKEILPMAVSIVTRYVPDEYRILENIYWEEIVSGINGNTTYKMSSDLSDVSGIKYKFLVANDLSTIEVEKEIIGNSDDTFTFDASYQHVFCYGKEVDDFHILEKNKIFALHHAAIQEIDRLQLEEKNKVLALETKNAELQSQIDNIMTILNKNNLS